MKTCQIVVFFCLLFFVDVNSSILFPRVVERKSRAPGKGKRWDNQEHNSRLKMRQLISFRNIARDQLNYVGMVSSPPLAFSPVTSGGIVLLASAIGYIGHKLNSEAVKRALFFWVHAGPIVAHYKFTRWYLHKTNAPLERRDRVYNSLHDRYCDKCIDIALHLKGLYVKITQVISSRPDFVPPQYIDRFTTVQDSIPQWPIEEVTEIVEKTLQSDCGLTYEEVFESIDPIALGSASIGQVHRAKIHDEHAKKLGGQNIVAIKVMHPGAEERFHHDFQVFRWLCKIALAGWAPILDECYRQIMTEFDYRREANSLHTIRDHMARSPYRNRVRIPEPLSQLCTKELLVMEMLEGKKFADAVEDKLADALGGEKSNAVELIKRKRLELILGKEKMESLGYKSSSSLQDSIASLGFATKAKLLNLYRKTQKYIDLLVDVQGYQVLSLGVFNGDPHPGNLLLLDDGKLGLIDYGQTKTISDTDRLGVARVVHAIGRGASDTVIAEAMRSLGFQTKLNDDAILAKYAALFFDSDVDAKKMGCATPQLYFAKLTTLDPLVSVPDVAIFVARASFIIRGMGTVLEKQVRTSLRWNEQARNALANSSKTTAITEFCG